jgi:co-chaperonin GroES (HSP10)
MFKPLHSFFVIDVIKREETTKSGILISNGVKPTSEAIIVYDNPNYPELKIGDKILIERYAPLEINTSDGNYTIIDYESIFGIIE